MDELQQAMCLGIFGAVLWDGGEDRLGMIAQDGKLDVEGRVEHHVGILLIWIYPFLFALAYGRPLADCLAGSESSLVVVAYDAAEQTVVACRNPVVVVERDSCECRGLDLVLVLIGNLRGEHRVESMDALDEQYLALAKLQPLAVVFALACSEVIFGNLDLLAFKQSLEITFHGDFWLLLKDSPLPPKQRKQFPSKPLY